jgi:hypothetical protein
MAEKWSGPAQDAGLVANVGANWPEGGPVSGPRKPLPKTMSVSSPINNWVEAKDPSSGRTYYANIVTRATSWTPPEEWLYVCGVAGVSFSHGHCPNTPQSRLGCWGQSSGF